MTQTQPPKKPGRNGPKNHRSSSTSLGFFGLFSGQSPWCEGLLVRGVHQAWAPEVTGENLGASRDGPGAGLLVSRVGGVLKIHGKIMGKSLENG